VLDIINIIAYLQLVNIILSNEIEVTENLTYLQLLNITYK